MNRSARLYGFHQGGPSDGGGKHSCRGEENKKEGREGKEVLLQDNGVLYDSSP